MRGDKLIIQPWHVRAAQQMAELVIPRIMNSTGRFVISIGGESGSGKSEIAAALSATLAERGIPSIILQQDDYFIYPPRTNERMRRQDINHVGIGEVHLDLLDRNLGDISNGGKEITKPLVIFDQDRITRETISLDGVKTIIVDGTYTTALRNVDCRVFIDCTHIHTRAARRQRARETQDAYLERVLAIEHEVISAHKQYADIIITADYEVEENEAKHE